MNFIETHTHLYVEQFDEDRDIVVQRALDAGIDKFFLPAIDSRSTQAMYDLQQAYPDHMYLMTGLHPVSVAELDYERELELVEKELEKKKFYAIGEIGIDLHWHPESLEVQKEVFARQIQLAKKHQLPIVIHCRDAFNEIFEVLEKEKFDGMSGIFHCFTGTFEQAKKAIGLGMKLGLGGVLTFKNGGIDKFMHKISLDHLVLETDSPYLAPSPYRGKRNESSYLIKVAEKLASIYEVGLDEIAERTTANAKAVFNI